MVGLIKHVYNQTVADGTATSVVRPSDWNSSHNQTITLGGNTAGASTISGTGIVLAGGNNVTLSADTLHGSVIISGPNTASQSIQTWNVVSGSGNTLGTITSFSTGTIVIAGGNNITLSQSSNTITILGPNTSAQSNQTGNIYAISNTFGTSSGTYNASVLSIAGSGAVGVAASASGWIISAPNQTNQSLGLYASSQTFGTSSSTVDARSLSVVGQGIVSVGMSGGSLVLSATTAAAASQTNQTLGIYASSQTFGTSSSTIDARSLSVVGQGVISVGMSGGSIVLSATTVNQTNQSLGVYASS